MALKRKGWPSYRYQCGNFGSTAMYGFTDQDLVECNTLGNYKWQEHDGNHGNGDFWLKRDAYSFGHQPVPCYTSTSASASPYNGTLGAQIPSNMWNLGNFIDGSDNGADAWNRMKPTEPTFNLLNTIFELRELPSLIRGRFTDDLMGAGNYYLALQFGWKPLLNDVRSMVNFQRNAQKKLAQLLRDNGKPVRRFVKTFEYTDGETVIRFANDAQNFSPLPLSSCLKGTAKSTVVRKYTDTVWASARMRYWLPPGPKDVEWTKKMMHRLAGWQFPSPSVIYNAVPWSWLIDWFSNVGDVISNLDAGVADRLAADYFYVMRKRTNSATRTLEVPFRGYMNADLPVVLTSSRRFEHLSRIRGSPFGFAVSQESLSGTQLAILGALGASRA